jgi:signal transduction histidine kinase
VEGIPVTARSVLLPEVGRVPLCSPPFEPSLGLEGRLEALERERQDLWSRLFHLERLGQAGLMAGGLVHDTRNLLAALSGHCQLAQRDDLPPVVQEHLQKSVDLAQKASKAMTVFLTFARGHGHSSQVCRIGEVVADAARFLEPALKEAETRVDLCIEDGLLARCEPTLLLQALVNLVLNAVRAIGDRAGVVEIRGHRAANGDAVLEVADDGPGVPAAVRASLFQPFATAPGLRAHGSEAAAGTGLGLFVTRRVLEEQGGSIVLVDSRAPGATFRITLPSGDAATAATRADHPPVAPAAGDARHV